MSAPCLASGDVLLVIDLQRQFTDADGPLRVDGADELIAGVDALATVARARDAGVVWVRQVAREELPASPATRRHRHGADLHRGRLAELDPRLTVERADSEVSKPRQSAFYGTDLMPLLRARDARRLVLVGVTTNVCVLATALDAAARDLPVVVVGDLTAARPVTRSAGADLDARAVRETALAFIEYAAGPVADAQELVGAE